MHCKFVKLNQIYDTNLKHLSSADKNKFMVRVLLHQFIILNRYVERNQTQNEKASFFLIE